MKTLPRGGLTILSVSLLVIAVTTPGQQPASSTAQTTQYSSPRYGFAIDIPIGWVLEERPQLQEEKHLVTAMVLIATEQSRTNTGAFNVNMTVAVRDIPEVRQLSNPREIAEFAARILESPSSSPEASIVKTLQQNGLVGAQREFRYVQSYKGKEVPLSATVTALVSTRRERCFLITATAPAESAAQYEISFQGAVESFDELE